MAVTTDVLPVFARLAGHPLRWRLLTALAGSDLRVRELTVRINEQQSLISYHLRILRDAGMVAARRSSADGRDTYYHLDVDRCGQLLTETGRALHPALAGPPQIPAAAARPVRVLFACTGNSGRSPMAAALLAQAGGGSVEAVSGGSRPKPVSRDAVRAMRAYGIDLSGHRSAHLDEFTARRFDYVITLCDKVREVCPEFRGHPNTIHWSLPDPGAVTDAAERRAAFLATAAQLQSRIGFLLAAIRAAPPGRPR